MNRDLMVHVTPFEVHVAILEDDVLVEYHVERRRDRSVVGNIYKGKVDKVLPGMQSAFVDISLEKNAFLYVTDFLEEFSELAETVEDDGVRAPHPPHPPRPSDPRPALPPDSRFPEPEPPEAEPEADEGVGDVLEPAEGADEALAPGASEAEPAPASSSERGERTGRRRSRRRGRSSRSRGQAPFPADGQSTETAPSGTAPDAPLASPVEPEAPVAEEPRPAPISAPPPTPPAPPPPPPAVEAEPPAPAAPEAAGEPGEKPAPPKRRTRRPTKKQTAAAAEGAAAAGAEVTEGSARVTLPDESPAHSQGRSRGRRRHNRNFNTAAENEPGNISSMLRQGQEIIVQVVKEPISLKSARITSHISLPGRMLVFLPTFNRIGVSRKIRADHERKRLRQIVKNHLGDRTGGFIIRTASEGCSEADLIQDVDFLLKTWQDIQALNTTAKAPALLYEEPGIVERILRDRLDETVQTIWVDDEAHFAAILSFMERFMPSMLGHVKLYNRTESLYEFFNIVPEVQKAMRQKVWLKSGGFIVINHTEAMVAIDVNTGRYVGKGSNFEETITRTNMDAAKEIVRQIRLRNLGGIIVMDFIDMQDKKGRKSVMDVMMLELKKDKAPSKVLSFNEFGLVAMTRKRTSGALEKSLSDPCPCCDGNGFVKSISSTCYDIYTTADRMRGSLKGQTVIIRAQTDIIRSLKGETAEVVKEIASLCGGEVVLVSDPAMPYHAFDISTA